MVVTGLLVAVPLMTNVTWHVNLLWMAAVALLAITVIVLSLRHLREKKIMRELLAEQEQKALRAQLNPHLLQNTFEIMASRLVEQNTESAISFIHQVSSYLRNVLDVSDKSVITLEEELELTEKYLALQKSMFDGMLEYNINVAGDIDTYGVDVPSMLLQPIVENSIRHGFRNKPGAKGIITVTLQQEGEEIICTIADNGTGLPDKPAGTEHVSKGLRLTIRRLELVCRTSKQRPVLHVKGNATGGVTTVIKIPAI